MASADYRLGGTGRGVVVWRDDADVIRDAAHMEVLGHLLFVEEAVVAAAHRLLGSAYLLDEFVHGLNARICFGSTNQGNDGLTIAKKENSIRHRRRFSVVVQFIPA
jgi:hypothetical protein